MTIAPEINTDLVTPLGAYVRLRREGKPAFLLESVERGRLGRHSLVGCGSRLCDLAEAEACGEPVVGYLAYDYAARLEPTVPLPDDLQWPARADSSSRRVDQVRPRPPRRR
jgi:hypothetical protein